jgi:hypothetical protein
MQSSLKNSLKFILLKNFMFTFLVREIRQPQQLTKRNFDQIIGGCFMGDLQCKVAQKIVWSVFI